MIEYVVHRFNGRISDDAPAGRRGMHARLDLFGPKNNAEQNNPTDGIVLSAIPAIGAYHMTVFQSMRPTRALAEEAEDMGFILADGVPEAYLVTAPDLVGLAAKLRRAIAPGQGCTVIPAGTAWNSESLLWWSRRFEARAPQLARAKATQS